MILIIVIINTTYHGPHQTTSFVSILPHSSAHSKGSCIRRPSLSSHSICHPVVHLIGTRDVDLVWSSSCSLDRPASSRHWSGPWSNLWTEAVLRVCEAIVERRNNPSAYLTTTTNKLYPIAITIWIGSYAHLYRVTVSQSQLNDPVTMPTPKVERREFPLSYFRRL